MNKRCKQILIRVAPEEKAAIAEAAESLEVSISGFIRLCASQYTLNDIKTNERYREEILSYGRIHGKDFQYK